MPTPIWEAELSFDGFAYTPTPVVSSNPADANEWLGGLEAICLPILDPLPQFNATPDQGNFALLVGIIDRPGFPFGAAGAFQVVTFRFGDSGIMPPQWTTTFLTPAISGGDPALLAAGATLSITKDYDSDLMTFTGPLGTQTVALTALDALPDGPFGYYNNTPLRPRGYAHRLHLQIPTILNPAFTVDDTFSWYNLIGKQDGVAYQTVALSTGDPGTWWPINNRDFVPGTGTVDEGLAPWWTYSQLATRQQVEGNVLAASYPDWTDSITWKRLRNPSDLSIDMERSTEHGVLYRAGPAQAMPSQMDFERSFDNGHSWGSPIVVASDGAWMNASPSLNAVNGRLYLCWDNGTNIIESRSLDGGAFWSMPVTIPFTGTNPRRIADKNGGGSYYFYVDGSGNIKVAVTYDNGASFRGPYMVAAGVGAQQIDAEFAPDSSIVVSYIDGGIWKQVRSRDLGATWV